MVIGEYNNLSQRLSSLFKETTAQAVIILRRKRLLAQASKFPPNAIEELVDLINRLNSPSFLHLQNSGVTIPQRTTNGDLVRFIQLLTTQDKYFLYALTLSRETLLALVFDPDTQFSLVRRQTHQMARELLSQRRATPLEYRVSGPEVGKTQPHQPNEEVETPAPVPYSDRGSLAQGPKPAAATGSASISELTQTTLTATPPVRPDVGPAVLPPDLTKEAPPEEIPEKQAVLGEAEKGGYHDSSELDSQAQGPGSADLPQPGETVSTPSFGQYIAYSCLLVPRMPQHLLTSNLASHLFKWMGQLCLAYGWRLEHLSIHSNHVQWIAGAPLTTSPASLVRTLRQKTSHYIFTQFPPLTTENPSGDFWAPGFFITGGKQSFQPGMIDNYINEIRTQQGVYNSSYYP